MRKSSLIVIVIALLASFSFHSASAKQKDAHFRLVNFIEAPEAKLTITNLKNGEQVVFTIDYGKSMKYVNLSPDHYQFSILIENEKVLEQEFVIGANGFYTLVLAGMLTDDIQTNEYTTIFKLKKLFGGETKDDNNFMPQWYMLRDNYDGSTKAPYVRFVNVSPSSTPLSVQEQNSKLFKKVLYPHNTDMKKITGGSHRYEIKKGDITVSEIELKTTAGYVYTIFTGPNMNDAREMKTIVLENKSKALMMQKN
ncbi:DUF4397 domain-containing protein [Fulvivirga maritima]|uniref:DUF4397 domain-containing protein n=1 Tax=Fulvivirga maritima TaxID=2904247 RepID=UPI001F3A7AB8|nr:DUF4397 domain-containing protein [Fulvivirga maritima]UII25476.1 DUF4397 domain-containing protein [Fulvivirga maritima]